MKTASLLRALNAARPCLGPSDSSIPILSHFCFAGDMLYAYDLSTAIIVEEETGLNCALHGDTLIGLLEALGEGGVTIKEEKSGAVQLKTASGWMKVPSLPMKESSFELPEEEGDEIKIPLTPEVLRALELCLISVGEDSVKPEFSGVTLLVSGGAIAFFSTDNTTATRFRCAAKFVGRKSCAAVLPAKACTLILKLAASEAEDKKVFALNVGSKSALASFGSITLMTVLLPAKTAVYEKLFAEHVEKGNFGPVPEGLAGEIAKACVLLGREQVKDCVLAFLKDTVLISAKGTLGKMESILPAKKMHPAAVKSDPTLIARVLPHATEWACNGGRSLCFSNGPFATIISSKQVDPQEKSNDDIPF